MHIKAIPSGKIHTAADVGRMVAARRKAQGLTQAELAALGQLGTRFVSELERGKGTVQFDKVMQVLALLGLSLVVGERNT